jgi:hypothetical protein
LAIAKPLRRVKSSQISDLKPEYFLGGVLGGHILISVVDKETIPCHLDHEITPPSI